MFFLLKNFNLFFSAKIIDKIEKTVYYIKMTYRSILFVRREILGKEEGCKRSEKKKNNR